MLFINICVHVSCTLVTSIVASLTSSKTSNQSRNEGDMAKTMFIVFRPYLLHFDSNFDVLGLIREATGISRVHL
jgi:hypothetical protein